MSGPSPWSRAAVAPRPTAPGPGPTGSSRHGHSSFAIIHRTSMRNPSMPRANQKRIASSSASRTAGLRQSSSGCSGRNE